MLGPTRVQTGALEHPLRGLPARVLCHIAIAGPQPIATDTLIDRAWNGEPPASARTAVQVAVHKLRKILEERPAEPEVLLTVEGGYALNADRCRVDLWDFERGVGEARNLLRLGGGVVARAELTDLLEDVWGEPFGSHSSAPSLLGHAERLHERRRLAEELLSDAELRAGEPSISRLTALVDAEPLRERRWEHLMLALHMSGRQADALRTFQMASRALARVGLVPGDGLVELEDRILRRDPSLLNGRFGAQDDIPMLLGRDHEVTALLQAIAPGRIVSVTGLPGIGKTEIVQHVATVLRRQGRSVVSHEPRQPADLLIELASSIAPDVVHEDERHALRVIASLTHDPVIVLDGPRAGDVGGPVRLLMEAIPAGSVIVASPSAIESATSVVEVGPLAVPGQVLDDRVWAVPSMRVFAARADAVGQDVTPHAASVSALVRRLDGHPLSIEIMAGLTTVLSVEQMLSDVATWLRKGDRAGLSETMQFALDRFDRNQRDVLAAVSVFEGEWTVSDARFICHAIGVNWDRLDLTRAISLSMIDHRGGGIYRMPECVRSALIEVVDSLGRQRLISAVRNLIIELTERLRGPIDSAEYRRLVMRHADIERTLTDAAETADFESALSVFGHLGHFWWIIGARATATRWAHRLIGGDLTEVKAETAIRALMSAAIGGHSFTAVSANKSLLLDAAAIVPQLPPNPASADALACLAMAEAVDELGSPVAAALADRAESMAQLIDEPFSQAFAQLAVAIVRMSGFDFDGAKAMFHRVLGTAEESGIATLESLTWSLLGHVNAYAQCFEEAFDCYEQGVVASTALGADSKLATSARFGAAEAKLMLSSGDELVDELESCFSSMRRIRDGRGAILAACRLAQLHIDAGSVEDAERRLGFAKAHLRVHDEEPIRVTVNLTEALLDATAGRYERAGRAFERAKGHLEAGGIPLGPVDVALYARVERELAAVAVDH